MKSLYKYLLFLSLGWQNALKNHGSTFGRVFLYLLLIAAYQQVWKVTLKIYPSGFSTDEMVWYIMITEWIILSVPRDFILRMEEEAHDGSIAYSLMRPISFIWVRVAEGLGATLVSLIINGVCGCAFAFFLTYNCPLRMKDFLFVLPLVTLAAFLELLLETIIALTAFWVFESRPFFWIYQKIMFVLGGLILPLTLYPVWLQMVAKCTPFSIMLFGTARMALHSSSNAGVLNIQLMFFWILVSIVFLFFIFEKCRRQIEVGGG